MAIKFTDDQQKVIDARHKNVLVSAAAGSGKTAVLVERIVKLVCDPENKTDIDELLVVTFTRAAASEMRERILKRISEELEKNPESAHLQKQYALVHRAMITTIDSFCQNVLRNHFQETDIDPDFRVMDEGEKELMRKDVITELLEEKYVSADPEFLNAVEFFSPKGNSDKVLEGYILELQKYSESFDRPEIFLEKQKENYTDTRKALESGELGNFMRRFCKGMLEGYISGYGEILKMTEEPDGPYMYAETIEKELEALKKSEGADIFELGDKLQSYIDSCGRLPGKKDDSVNPDKKEYVKNTRTGIKDSIKAFVSDFYSPSLDTQISRCNECAEPMRELIDLTIEYRRRLQERKRDKKVVDFGDMEHYALEILTTPEGEPTPVALEYRDHFKEIMVDEYQDSNLIQDIILSAIARTDEGHFDKFMVGDVKQSIYGFRQARPDLFLEKYNTYPNEDGCERIDLSKNFRSRREVLTSVNDVFEKVMHKDTGRIEYDEAARLNIGADYPDYDFAKAELLLLDSKLADELNEDSDEEISSNESEAVVIAQVIRDLMENHKVTESVKDGDGKEIKRLRPLKYSDIVVLHRSPSGMAEALSKIFEKKGIPVSIGQGSGYFSAPEIKQVLQLLRAINNPIQDIPLFGAMRSYFGGYSDSQIAEVRASGGGKSLYDCVKKNAPEFIERLEKYRKMATYRTIRECLQYIFDEYNYLDYVLALPGGTRRRANVEMLLNYASDFEKTSYFGLHDFVRYIDQLEKYTEDNTAEADVLGENSDVVRFMSVHKSKGLEFPVTILAGMGHGFMDRDQTNALNHDNELGIGCEYMDLRRRVKSNTLRHELIARKLREDSRAEELRLLYVAMTRAKEKLIMIGRCKDAGKKLDAALQGNETVLGYSNFMSSRCPLDFILPVLAGCSIKSRVVTSDDIAEDEAAEQIAFGEKRRKLQESEALADAGKLAGIKERLAYRYPYSYLSKLCTKTTVSELKMAAMLDENEAAFNKFENREKATYIPKFRKETEEITGPVRGDAYHRVMEIMDYDVVLGALCGGYPATYEEFLQKAPEREVAVAAEKFMEEMRDTHRITEQYFKAVNKKKAAEFLRSNLCYRMWGACLRGELYREQPFVLSINASRLEKDYPESEKVIIQGIIDAYFVENGNIILMDYKTDSAETDEEFVTRYAAQLDYYKEAVGRLTGLAVKEKYLYSFHLGRVIPLD